MTISKNQLVYLANPLPLLFRKAGFNLNLSSHAGYRYSGKTAASAYACLSGHKYKRIIVVGPSHHAYMENKVGITSFDRVKTPLGDIPVDTTMRDNLLKNATFKLLPKAIDEEEHSLEMQYPFLRYITRNKNTKIIPLLIDNYVTSDQAHKENVLLVMLREIIENELGETLLVISSDFCHWGKRFNYTHLPADTDNISKGIESLNMQAIAEILNISSKGFLRHLKQTGNTICGRYPILFLMELLEGFMENKALQINTKLLAYEQSNQVFSEMDSCVCYASLLFAF